MIVLLAVGSGSGRLEFITVFMGDEILQYWDIDNGCIVLQF